ncbi:MAG: hypothetical protein FWF71_07210 [Actinomycetia bacterium]|nr:hypothetical protein [Actinomycetes bacterium]
MGAGNGSLSLPLLASGYRVLAADFSPAMLAELSRRYYGCTAALDGPLDCVQVDFNAPFDTWEALAITRGSVDVAIASRSTMVADLAAAFGQLELSAKRSVAVTMATEYGPRSTKRLGQDDGSGVPFIPDYVYALNILLQHGRYPSLSWIDSWKPTAEANCLRLVRWAFISWDVPIPLFSSHASGNVGVA